MARIDPATIGADRPHQNPQKALEAAEGVYTDRVEVAPLEARLPLRENPQRNCPLVWIPKGTVVNGGGPNGGK